MAGLMPEVILLPDEPYRFSDADRAEFAGFPWCLLCAMDASMWSTGKWSAGTGRAWMKVCACCVGC